jgi:hypothetical protein
MMYSSMPKPLLANTMRKNEADTLAGRVFGIDVCTASSHQEMDISTVPQYFNLRRSCDGAFGETLYPTRACRTASQIFALCVLLIVD